MYSLFAKISVVRSLILEGTKFQILGPRYDISVPYDDDYRNGWYVVLSFGGVSLVASFLPPCTAFLGI